MQQKKNKINFTNRQIIKKAFTLVELLVVIAIIGVLSTIALIGVANLKSRSNYAKIFEDMNSISKAANVYKTTTTDQSYPIDATVVSTCSGGLPVSSTGADVGFKNYFNLWPTPPCDGMHYDWNNWTTAKVVLRLKTTANCQESSASNPAKFYYCVGFNSSSDCNDTSGGWTLGTNIRSLSEKKITCKE